ncbi:RNA polymerase sigma factor [Kibdelosporangium phytohabitans]|uniref:RNA polymerase subunit sigma-24 n=1 Tax=Kibdelosporangium phytohabitans TaxID=860235 RepID=A0A0N9HXC1_9PSEU|nr:RNA polymerase sigma factor [Kibdelosporangium phytohabitans]ALG09976.1 RNA polymerase subunit sigma-24 [Kibdelosporangium phytohabitans]MBE1468608.1 RNA polymerase sigma-70 factor (ECF subfamily) [Kibdelosporangium phytohabitans]
MAIEATDVLLAALADDLDPGFADLVHTYEGVLFAAAMRASGNAAEAEELAAESFLRAYVALRGYERWRILALRPQSWLLTIMLNTWRNSVRSASRRPPQTLVAGVADEPAAGQSVEQQVTASETRRELTGLMWRLPDDQRVAVALRHVVGLPVAEVATLMHIPEGTAKSHTCRGLRALRGMYASRYR